MTPHEQTTVVLDPSLLDFTTQVIDLAREGWELDEENPPRMVGFMYEAHMWRDPTEEQRNAQPPLSRAEILAKARAAKAEKAAARAAGDQPAEGKQPGDDAPY